MGFAAFVWDNNYFGNGSDKFGIFNRWNNMSVDAPFFLNGIQEAIFSLIERDNIFVVGDVKQSIYGFRGSDSDIFLNGLKNHEADGKTTVNLSVNFRSTKGVLSCVNNVFGDIMPNFMVGCLFWRRTIV